MAIITPGGHGLGYRRNPNRAPLSPLAGAMRAAPSPLPAVVDFRDRFLLPVPDQGQYGTCTANAGAAIFEYELLRQGVPVPHRKSRAFNYYTAGAREGDTTDDGRDPHYTFLAMQVDGLCDESYWPYDGQHIVSKPDAASYKAASHRHALRWYAVEQTASAVKAALAAGYAIAIGIQVCSSFEGQQAEQTGIIPIPATGERVLGGHMLAVVGYADIPHGTCPAGYLIVRNSWGPDFGDQGHVYLPYSYLWLTADNGYALTMDLIALELVTGPVPPSGALPTGQMAGGGTV